MEQTQTTSPTEDRQAIDAADAKNARAFAIAIIAAAALYTAAYAYRMVSAGSECLQAGWPHGKVDLTLTQYCVRFDTVVPLKEIRRP